MMNMCQNMFNALHVNCNRDGGDYRQCRKVEVTPLLRLIFVCEVHVQSLRNQNRKVDKSNSNCGFHINSPFHIKRAPHKMRVYCHLLNCEAELLASVSEVNKPDEKQAKEKAAA